jgi:hypothetical protein
MTLQDGGKSRATFSLRVKVNRHNIFVTDPNGWPGRSAFDCSYPRAERPSFAARLSVRFPIFLSIVSSCCSSSEETSPKARLMSAVWRRKRGTNICRPFSVSDTVLTLRSRLLSARPTNPFLYRRSTATLTDPGLRLTLGQWHAPASVPYGAELQAPESQTPLIPPPVVSETHSGTSIARLSA